MNDHPMHPVYSWQRKAFDLLLAMLLCVSGFALGNARVAAEALDSHLRFGIAANRNPLNYDNFSALKAGWYHNWGPRPFSLRSVPDVEFCPMVGAWGDIMGSETAEDLRYYISRCPESYPPGTIWIVGNELDIDTFNGRRITPEEYARKFKKYHDIIKAIDPSYKLAVGAAFNNFVSEARAAYRRLYGTKMPIDVYNVHAYMDTSAADILNQVKIMVNNTRRQMKENGDRDKWLIITETGALYNAGAETISRFMRALFAYLTTATSAEYGCPSDGNRLVQRWAWFALTSWDPINARRWQGTDLIDVDTGAMTAVGRTYSSYPKGPPMLPSAFWGTVTVGGSSVPTGTVVTAWISGTQVAQTTTLLNNGVSVYSLDIPGDNPDTPEREGGNEGEEVRFKIGPGWAKESGIWQSGGVSGRDLSADLFALPAKRWIASYGYSAGGWTSQDKYPRALADVDGDGRADVVGFGSAGVYVSLSTGSRFNSPRRWIANYGRSVGGWTSQNLYPRMLADVDGDGKADVVGFFNDGVYVSRSTGSGFTTAARWIASYGYSVGGWTSQDSLPRALADVDGDGRADVVGFGSAGVYVSLSTGSRFNSPKRWIANYGRSVGGWTSQNLYPRMLADVNGDGKADIVGFASGGVYVSLSTGSSFSTPVLWINSYGVNAGSWTSQDRHPRLLADMNGDGKADIVGFGNSGTLVSLSTGSGFSAALPWSRDFGANAAGWSTQDRHPRAVADLNGDQKADIVGFGNDGVYVSLAISPLSGSKLGTTEPALEEEERSSEEAALSILPDEVAPEVDFITWRGEYFANSFLAGEPALVREDQDIDFDWGEEAPDPSLPAEAFSVRWTCTLPFEEGDYVFHLLADDGARLLLDGQLLMDRWAEREAGELTAQIRLTAEEHTLILEYFEISGGAQVRLWWERVKPAQGEIKSGVSGGPPPALPVQ